LPVAPEAARRADAGLAHDELADIAGPEAVSRGVDDVGPGAGDAAMEAARLDREEHVRRDDAADFRAARVVLQRRAGAENLAVDPEPRLVVPRLARRGGDAERRQIVLRRRVVAVTAHDAREGGADAE